jgi:acyl carrier protein phosphodiesterase
MMSDFVKGKQQYTYAANIQKGIRLHRAIDAFTDAHPATKQAKQYLKPSAGLYAGAFIDVVYDYFLANDTQQFANATVLATFAATTYEQLNDFMPIYPLRFQQILPKMQQHNWLNNYQFTWAIEKSFMGLVRRATYLPTHEPIFEAFMQHIVHLQLCYNALIPDVKYMAQSLLDVA